MSAPATVPARRRRVPRAVLIVAVAVLVIAVAGWPQYGWRLRPHTDAPHADSLPADAGPREVLQAYLVALKDGDCQAAHTFVTSTFTIGNGELCGGPQILGVGALSGPASGTTEFATQLTIAHGDDSLPDRQLTWFYQLDRQADGRWRLTSGGSGP